MTKALKIKDAYGSRSKKQELWLRQWTAWRSRSGACSSFLQEISSDDSRETVRFLRVSHATSNELLKVMEPAIGRQDGALRRRIKPEERLLWPHPSSRIRAIKNTWVAFPTSISVKNIFSLKALPLWCQLNIKGNHTLFQQFDRWRPRKLHGI